jgi:hypothetical protein
MCVLFSILSNLLRINIATKLTWLKICTQMCNGIWCTKTEMWNTTNSVLKVKNIWIAKATKNSSIRSQNDWYVQKQIGYASALLNSSKFAKTRIQQSVHYFVIQLFH